MPSKKLTQPFVDSASPPNGERKVDYFDTVCKGLLFEVRQHSCTYYHRRNDALGKMRQWKVARSNEITLKQVREIVVKNNAIIISGGDPYTRVSPVPEPPSFQELIETSYLPHVKGYKRSWRTDECLLRKHILPAIGKLSVEEIKRHHMVSLFTNHLSTHKPASTNRVIILCRYIFNCAIRWEVAGITRNPTAGIELYPENNKLERFLSDDEVRMLFAALEQSHNTQLKYIVSILLLTGARKREVLDARWADFDLERRIWTIRINKTGKPRYIPISDGLLLLLDKLPRFEGCEHIVPNPETLKPYKCIFGAWDNARKRAGLPEVRIHDLRHSFASFLINSGRSLYEVQKILGHTQVKTTQRYAHLSQDSLISAANTAIPSVPLVADMPADAAEVPLIEADTEDL